MVESPTDNLRREMTQRLTDLDARVTQRFELEEKERSNALAAQDKRLELLNELRTGVMTRAEYEAKHKAIEDRLRAVEKLAWMAAGAGGIIGAILGALTRLIH
jgi:muconolactone delta-isomerase